MIFVIIPPVLAKLECAGKVTASFTMTLGLYESYQFFGVSYTFVIFFSI